MAQAEGDVLQALTRAQSALDELARALERRQTSDPPAPDATVPAWPGRPPGPGLRRITPAPFPTFRT